MPHDQFTVTRAPRTPRLPYRLSPDACVALSFPGLLWRWTLSSVLQTEPNPIGTSSKLFGMLFCSFDRLPLTLMLKARHVVAQTRYAIRMDWSAGQLFPITTEFNHDARRQGLFQQIQPAHRGEAQFECFKRKYRTIHQTQN